MMHAMLQVDVRDAVTVIQLDHGPVNALDLELLDAISDAVAHAEGAIVLTGAGKSFSAGVDLRRIVEGDDSHARDFLAALAQMFVTVFNHPGPTVAAVNGHAIAGGCLLALCCDLRMMSTGKIGLTELAVGVEFPRAGLEIVRYALGPAANRCILGADTVSADEALRRGWIDEVVDAESLVDQAITVAAQLATLPQPGFTKTKQALHQQANEAINAGSDEAVLAAWSTDATRKRLTEQLAAMSRRSTG